MTAKTIPTESLVNSFIRVEKQLVESLHYIPYCDEHHDVWSDLFVPIIIESCTLLDSYWNAQSKLSPYVEENNLSIVDYFRFFGERVESDWILFRGEKIEKIYPYKGWTKTGKFKTQNDYETLDWWKSYNQLKHNRLLNRKSAKLIGAVKALSALLLAMINSDHCKESIENAEWLEGNSINPKVHLGNNDQAARSEWVVLQTRLFTYPVGWTKTKKDTSLMWLGPGKAAFKQWFDQSQWT